MTIATVGGEMRRATATDVVLDLEQMWLGTAVDEVFRDTVGRSVDEYLTDRSAVGLACSEPDRASAWRRSSTRALQRHRVRRPRPYQRSPPSRPVIFTAPSGPAVRARRVPMSKPECA